MSRLPPLPLPPARGCGKSRFFAALGAMLMAVALAARRFDLIDTETLLASLALAVGAALLALVFVGVTLADIWREGRKSSGGFSATVLLILLTLAPPTAAGLAAVRLPAVAGLSTDAEDPPALPAVAGARLPFDLLAPVETRADLTAAAYPDIGPLYLDVAPADAFALARLTAGELGWTVTEATAPSGETASGRLVASGHSLFVGLPFDAAVRIEPNDDGSRLDLTAMNRDPLPDLGENARVLRAFVVKLREIERRPSSGSPG